jgi:hypothetical protein
MEKWDLLKVFQKWRRGDKGECSSTIIIKNFKKEKNIKNN